MVINLVIPPLPNINFLPPHYITCTLTTQFRESVLYKVLYRLPFIALQVCPVLLEVEFCLLKN